MKGKGSDKYAILREAQAVADRYVRTAAHPVRRRLPPALFAGIGVLAAAGIWAALRLLGVV